MKFEAPAEKPAAEAANDGIETVVHPFVQAMRAIGSGIGRDIGVLALRAIEAQKGGVAAVLYWQIDNVPEVIKLQVPTELLKTIQHVFVLPAGTTLPPLGAEVFDKQRILKRDLADGSQLILFSLPPDDAAGT